MKTEIRRIILHIVIIRQLYTSKVSNNNKTYLNMTKKHKKYDQKSIKYDHNMNMTIT